MAHSQRRSDLTDDSLMRHIWWPYVGGSTASSTPRPAQVPALVLSPRCTVFSISLICLIFCVLDKATSEDASSCATCALQRHVDSLRDKLRDSFQAANLMLLLASVIEWSSILQLYVWFTLAFVVLGLVIAILDFLFSFRKHGAASAILSLVPQVTFLFVLFRCLPLVVRYGKELEWN